MKLSGVARPGRAGHFICPPSRDLPRSGDRVAQKGNSEDGEETSAACACEEVHVHAAQQARKAVAVQSPIRSRAVLIAIIALSGTVIIAAMGRAREPERVATDVRSEAAAAADEFAVAPEVAISEAYRSRGQKAPASSPETKPVAAAATEVPHLETTEVVAPPPMP